MENIQIKIINPGSMAFRDTTVGAVYDAIILTGEEEVPHPWCPYAGYKNDGQKSLLLIDDVEDDVAVNFDEYEGIAFIQVSE